MIPNSDQSGERLEELLADRALEGLSTQEQAELSALGGQSEESWDMTAASADFALWSESALEPLPERLRSRILAARSEVAANQRVSRPLPFASNRGVSPILAWTGWLAAAAMVLAIAVIEIRPASEGPQPVSVKPRSEAELMDRLAITSPKATLKATDHPLANGAFGELVWNREQQKGFMTIKDLPPVDPNQGTYQLWIFDKNRDSRYPVDGGTFVVAKSQEPTIVPIQAKLPVSQPTLFAITLEQPGGVVVSDRQRIMLTATWEAAN